VTDLGLPRTCFGRVLTNLYCCLEQFAVVAEADLVVQGVLSGRGSGSEPGDVPCQVDNTALGHDESVQVLEDRYLLSKARLCG